MHIYPAQDQLAIAIDLLKQNNLSTQDISPETKLFVLRDGRKVVGTIGLEHDSQNGLLRSLSVSSGKRKSGLGQHLVSYLEEYAKEQGIHTMYLLTNTAADFFSKRGYQKIQRSNVPEFIQKTSEFSSICPTSATVMKKELL